MHYDCVCVCVWAVAVHSPWYGMVWYGMVWYGMVWYGMTLCCVRGSDRIGSHRIGEQGRQYLMPWVMMHT